MCSTAQEFKKVTILTVLFKYVLESQKHKNLISRKKKNPSISRQVRIVLLEYDTLYVSICNSYKPFRPLVERRGAELINEKGQNAKLRGNENCGLTMTM